MRFDELELETVPPVEATPVAASEVIADGSREDAPRIKRLLALLIDLSLFVALGLALSPLLPIARDVWSAAALAGFVVLVSYYYYVGSWLLWGKTIGGAIFDVRVVPDGTGPMALRSASLRWAGVLVSLVTLGGGFLLAILPSRLSLPDRMSSTRCVLAA